MCWKDAVAEDEKKVKNKCQTCNGSGKKK